jgi:hypothetical protein
LKRVERWASSTEGLWVYEMEQIEVASTAPLLAAKTAVFEVGPKEFRSAATSVPTKVPRMGSPWDEVVDGL